MHKTIQSSVLAVALALGFVTAPHAQVSIGISTPNVSIGINLPVYPDLVVVPGYPVYYAPQVDANYFFYDGMYWVYFDDNWYASYWYNGPWNLVRPDYVPVYILRVPVRYYRVAPVYFRPWRADAPPRWGDHWGPTWQQRRSGWDRWDRASVPPPAPLPTYQRQYTGDRYPPRERQPVLHSENYRYQPRDNFVREQYRNQQVKVEPQPQARQAPPGQSRQDQDARPPTQQQQPVERGKAPAPREPAAATGQRDDGRKQAPPEQSRQGQDARPPTQQQPVERGKAPAPREPAAATGQRDDGRKQAPPQARRDAPAAPVVEQRGPGSQDKGQGSAPRPQGNGKAPATERSQVQERGAAPPDRGPPSSARSQPPERGPSESKGQGKGDGGNDGERGKK